ncbi:MAG TPA: pirin family protein [Holophagaceae bacterium]|jgi:redox-sensitive bicupin YhaK (pirin superfamily)|nr:pirin family protein [Holophagaceae bacterium]
MAIQGIPGRKADLGEGTAVRRLLPTRGRRLVGPWCFLDHYGPDSVQGPGMALGPHPHIGLQTVSWLFEGEVLHHDSIGSEQLIRPGQLNLMTSARGIAHSEESPSAHGPRLHGVQLWVALPESARHGAPAFEHIAELPQAGFDALRATVLMGSVGEAASPARTFSPMMGAELVGDRDGVSRIPLDPAFEHAVALVWGRAAIGELPVEVGVIYTLPAGGTFLELRMEKGSKVMLLGGAPFPEPILMWWNFVARTPEEMLEARVDWMAGRRFGAVDDALPVIPAPPLDPAMLRLRR